MSNPIVMLAGLPGTGKSLVADKLENRLDYDLHSLLGIRRDLGHKRYRPKQNPVVFHELYQRAQQSLLDHRGVILDNVYTSQNRRKMVYDMAFHYEVDVLIIECYCPEKESKRRMRRRPKNDGLVVEPRDPKVYDKLAGRWQDIKQDILHFSDYPLNYIRYDSKNNAVEEVKVNPNMKSLVDTIKSILLNNSQIS